MAILQSFVQEIEEKKIGSWSEERREGDERPGRRTGEKWLCNQCKCGRSECGRAERLREEVYILYASGCFGRRIM